MIQPSAFFRAGRSAGVRRLSQVGLVAVLAVCATGLHAAEDPYLQMLDREVAKVEAVPTDTGTDGAVVLRSAKSDAPAASRDRFEEILREQHVGTYTFYRKLPERVRAEIFADYSGGATVESLRGKIVDRFLHP